MGGYSSKVGLGLSVYFVLHLWGHQLGIWNTMGTPVGDTVGTSCHPDFHHTGTVLSTSMVPLERERERERERESRKLIQFPQTRCRNVSTVFMIQMQNAVHVIDQEIAGKWKYVFVLVLVLVVFSPPPTLLLLLSSSWSSSFILSMGRSRSVY